MMWSSGFPREIDLGGRRRTVVERQPGSGSRVRATRWRFAFYESENDALSSEEMAQRFGHRFMGAPRISCAAQMEG